MKKRSRKRWCVVLDGLCRDIIRLIHDNRCARCGEYITGSNSHPHHIVPKGKGASKRRFDLLNLILFCFQCHKPFWHDNPLDGMEWFEQSEYKARLPYLERYRYGKTSKISEAELEAKEIELKEKLEELKVSEK